MKFFRKEWNDFDKLKVIMDEFTQDDLEPLGDIEDTDKVEEVTDATNDTATE